MVFQCLLTMALWGSIAAIVVLAARPLVKKISNRIMCLLWLVVLFRFLCPVAFEREIPAAWANKWPQTFANLVQIEQEPEPQLEKVSLMKRPNLKSSSHGTETSTAPIAVSTIEKMAKEVEAALETSMEPPIEISGVTSIETPIGETVIDLSGLKEIFPMVLGGIWIIGGIAVMLGSMIKYYTIRRSLKEAIFIRKWGTYPVKTTDFSDVPMSFGVIHPGIYIPIGFDGSKRDVNGAPLTERQKDMIIWHEYMHLRRHDPLLKLLVHVMVSIHWWNPLAWLCVKCINQDIEMACDETVLSFIGRKKRGEYAEILLGFATEQNGASLMVSFGEGHAESRIKNALRFHKTPIWVSGATLLFALALGSCLSVRPVAAKEMTGQVSSGDAFATLQVSGGDASEAACGGLVSGGDASDYSSVVQVSSGAAITADSTPQESGDVITKDRTQQVREEDTLVVEELRKAKYESFKNGDEKVYFSDFDKSTFDGLDFDVEKGYTFSELMNQVYCYFDERNGEGEVLLWKNIVYLHRLPEDDSEMMIFFEDLNVSRSDSNDKNSLTLVFKVKNGKIEFTY